MRYLPRCGSRLFLTALISVACLLGAPAARADGFIVINPGPTPIPVPRGHFSFAPLEVSYHHVTVEIRDQVAITTVDQEFINPNSMQLEGTYLFPLQSGSHIDKFSMDINGKMQEAELLPADKARAIYEEIVRKAKDPALLEYMGRDTFKVRIFPIEPNGKKHITLKYTQLLKSDTGLVEYVYPLNTEKFSAKPLNNVSVKVTLNTDQPLKSVYCPSHAVEIKRDGASKAVIGYEEKNVRPDTDFKLVFSKEAKNDVGLNLLTYRNPGDGEGYFLLLASPGMDVKNTKVQPKDICLVLDTSGSMAGKKMDQARKALAFTLANLNEQDRFEIVRFSTEAEGFFDALKPATKENVDKAQAFVAALKPIGGTAIDEALAKALKLNSTRDQKADRPYVVIFLTDGMPTIGETREDAILDNVSKTHSDGVRVFSFGIGTEINTHLLDRLAENTKAFSQYVLPEEDVEVKLSNFYTKIKDPVLSNLELAFSGGGAGAEIKAKEIYPGTLSDLFKGDMLVVFGKYSGKGTGAVKITGTLNGEKKTFAQDVTFTDNDTRNDFIPRLWATRRVGFLLDQIRKNGETAELKDEVVRLARAHGIVTPYTAYLILEDEARRGVPVAVRTMRELDNDARAKDAAKSVYDMTVAESRHASLRGGDLAVANATNLAGLKQSENLQQGQQSLGLDKGGSFGVAPSAAATAGAGTGAGGAPAAVAAPAPAWSGDALALRTSSNGSLTLNGTASQPGKPAPEPQQGYRDNRNYASQARVVNGRAFYQNGNTWTDNTASTQKNLKQQNIKFGSEEYFALVKQSPDAAAWLSLGNEVDLVLGDTLYVVR